MTSKSAEVFSTLLGVLKLQGVHVAVAAKAIGENPVTVRGWNRRKSGPKKEHINALLLAFPTQLTAKAQELGIEIPVAKLDVSESERLELLLRVTEKRLEQAKEEIEKVKDQNSEEIKRLRAENDRLMIQVSDLIALMKKE